MSGKRETAVSQWATKHGHRFDSARTEFKAEGARELDMFRTWQSADHHVAGIHRDQSFEMIDVTNHYRGTARLQVTQTVLLMPGSTNLLPGFEILPRGMVDVLGALHIGGLEIRPPDGPQFRDAEIIKDFNRHYLLYKGGVVESVQSAIAPTQTAAQDFAELATLFRTPILRFLAQHPGWSIESQGGFLAISAHGRLLDDTGRNDLLSFAAELLSMLHCPPRSASPPAVQMQTVMEPKRLLGTVIGALVGFLVGTMTAGTLNLLSIIGGWKFMLLLPLLAIAGIALGGFVGGKIAQVRK